MFCCHMSCFRKPGINSRALQERDRRQLFFCIIEEQFDCFLFKTLSWNCPHFYNFHNQGAQNMFTRLEVRRSRCALQQNGVGNWLSGLRGVQFRSNSPTSCYQAAKTSRRNVPFGRPHRAMWGEKTGFTSESYLPMSTDREISHP